MKRFAILAAAGLFALLPSVASARGRVGFGFGFGFGGPAYYGYCYRPYWYGPAYYYAPSYVYIAPPAVYSPAPTVVYTAPAPVYAPAPAPTYSVPATAAPVPSGPVQTNSGGVTYYYYH
jgi:hypothetical protein